MEVARSAFEERCTVSIFVWRGSKVVDVARQDPVFLAETGHTFEREAISAWLEKHDTCPMTRQVLTTKALVPNWGLRSAIAEWRTKAQVSKVAYGLLLRIMTGCHHSCNW